MNSQTKTVRRRYSIKRILGAYNWGERVMKAGELQEAWGVDGQQRSRLINSVEGKGPQLTTGRLRSAAVILGVTINEILEPYDDEARGTIKI